MTIEKVKLLKDVRIKKKNHLLKSKSYYKKVIKRES